MKPQEIIALFSLFCYQILTKSTNETVGKNTTTTTTEKNENNSTTNVQTTDENIKNRTAVNSTKIPGNLTNVLLCKVTHLGVDYAGSIGKSESGVRCQSWTAKTPIHKIDPLFTDDKFSDFSKANAKHYCRNPNNEPLGPWCYTMDPDNIWETCGLPLCSYTECRITGPGMEYAGYNKKTITGKNCLKWNKKRPQVKQGKDVIIALDKYDSHLFPDEIRSDAKKFCRNPDGDIGGPWCFVETVNKKIVEKQFCDVPFCDDETCMVFTKNDDMYTHYTKFSEQLQNFTFGVKLWDPDQFLNASARLVLSLYALPVVATQIHDLGIGVEITITNKKTAVTAGHANKVEYENTKGFIKGHKFVYFSLTWWHNVITLFREGKKQPILMADLNSKDSVMSHKMNQFSFYAAQGTNMLWSFPFCDIEDSCDVYTTTQKNFQQFHPLRETSQGRDLEFHLRAFRSAYLLLVSSPTVQYPNFMIMLQRSDNITRFMYKNDVNSSAEVIAELFSDNILKYWTFQEFAVSIFLEECNVLVTKNGATHTILTVKHDSLKKMRWFSPSSEDTIAHWTFFCFPPDEARAPTPWLPECVLNKNEPYYNGTQAVTSQGNPCLPWAGQNIMPVEINTLFRTKEDKFKADNYCRDPKNEQKGSFCYTFQYDDRDLVVREEKCHIRKCKSAECKMAGTGNDYIGKLSTTRSNRTCQHWLSASQLQNLEYTAKKVVENSTVQNITIIEAPEAAASNKQKEEQLRVLNSYLESTQCEDKMRCLRSMFKVRRTRSNDTKGNGNDEHVNDSLKPSQEYSEAEPILNKTQATSQEQSNNDQNTTDKSQNTPKQQPDDDESGEATRNTTHENPETDPYFNISHNPPHELEVMHLEEIGGNPLINKMVEESVETTTSKYDYPYVHEVEQVLLNETLFADMNLLKIENFCRNPNRDVGGAWCYTTDPHVRFDLCNVRDCDKPEECTVIVLGGETGRKNYILPQWKETGHHGGIRVSLKQWNPDLITSFAFEFYPFESMNTSMKIIIGAEENEKLQCFFNGELVRQKTLPHLIPTGKWTGFWIQIRQGEIMIGFDGVPNPFFEWKHDHFATVFNPIMLNYYSQNHLPIGAYFGCDDCQLENVTTAQFTRFFPIGLWKEEGQTYKNFTLKVRGTGNLLIPLYILPNTHEFYAIEIGTKDGTVKVYQYGPGFAVTRKTEFNKEFQIPTNAWANLTIIFTETRLMVFSNTDDVMYFQSKTSSLLFYYFSVGVQNGWITWAANCEPMDIDGPPIDGGWSKWSPWVCTVTCGGGQGYRTRTCSNPRPNVFGKMCEGSATSTGNCNEFECGDISPETLDMIRQHLRDNYTSLVVNEGATVSIINYAPILNRITTESPDSYYEWTRNGLFLEPDPGRLEFSGDDIIISKATTKDSGVYVTMLFRINKQRVVLHVVSLAVNTKSYMIDTRATRKATLLTHSVVLGYVYKDLSQKWTLNDKTYIDYGITTMAAVSQEYLHPLNESHTGDWRCIVEQSDMKFRWTTNIIKMRVKTAPTLWTNLMEDELTAPLFSWMKTEINVQIALAVLVIIVIGSVALGLFLYLKVCRLKQPHLLKKKKSAKKQKRNRRFR